jgi:hypothetical protein
MSGKIYYQVLHGYRDPQTGEVRHRTKISLGRRPTISDALNAERSGLAVFKNDPTVHPKSAR